MLTEAKEARNVCVAVAIDGFNPYGMMAAPYSCWPVFVIQKGDLGIQLNYMSRLRIFLVLSVIRLRRTLRLV